jgi:ATP adenylyltransferase
MSYIQESKQENDCVFCAALQLPDSDENLIIHRGEQTFVILNRYPYTSGHLMVLPIEHHQTLDALNPKTRAEMMELVTRCIQVLTAEYTPQGFNVGANLGTAAGAGIPQHIHFHIVPRWSGDTNFMSAVGSTRVIPEAIEETYHRLTATWQKLS